MKKLKLSPNIENITSVYKFHIITVAIILFSLFYFIFHVYSNIIQLKELGDYSGIFMKNLILKLLFNLIYFLTIFFSIYLTSNYLNKIFRKNSFESKIISNGVNKIVLATITGFALTYLSYNEIHLDFILFSNSVVINELSPVSNIDIGFYLFKLPFLIKFTKLILIIGCLNVLWTIIIIFFEFLGSDISKINLKVASKRKSSIEILVNVCKKIFSTKWSLKSIILSINIYLATAIIYSIFDKHTLFLSNFNEFNGAGYIDATIWYKFYFALPILGIFIIGISIFNLNKNNVKISYFSLLTYPILFVLMFFTVTYMNIFTINMNDSKYLEPFVKFNIESTKKAYDFGTLKSVDFNLKDSDIADLDTEINYMNLDKYLKDNEIYLFDENVIEKISPNEYLPYTYKTYNFIHLNNTTPSIIIPRELDYSELKKFNHKNRLFNYTHGYGVNIIPVELTNKPIDGTIDNIEQSKKQIQTPQIYYGNEKTNNIIINAKNNISEYDYDLNNEIKLKTRYSGKGGIKLSFFNKLVLSVSKKDYSILFNYDISTNSRYLTNRNIVERAKLALPFLEIDESPNIILTENGDIKWVLDGYSVSSYYPYSQKMEYIDEFKDYNYIKNSVKIVIDAYDGNVECYAINKNDPIIKTYKNAYGSSIINDEIPKYLLDNLNYPEKLLRANIELLKKYYNSDKDIEDFILNSSLLDTDKIGYTSTSDKRKYHIKPYYVYSNILDDNPLNKSIYPLMTLTNLRYSNEFIFGSVIVKTNKDNYGEFVFLNMDGRNILSSNQIASLINNILSENENYSDLKFEFKNLFIHLDKNDLKYYYTIYTKSPNGKKEYLSHLIIIDINKNSIDKFILSIKNSSIHSEMIN